MNKLFKILTVGILLLSSFGGTMVAAQEPTSIVYGISTTPTGIFNPVLTDSIYDEAVCALVYDSLLTVDEKLNFEPVLAESYEVSDDNLSVTFKLKEGLKWSDGQDLTTEDIQFTLESLADKDYQGANYGFVEHVKGANQYHEGKADQIEGIEIDGNQIKLTFDTPYAPALTNIGTLGIIPKHIWSKLPMVEWKENKDLKNFVGSGPFKLDEFNEGQFVKVSKNDNYHEDVKTDQIILKVVNEDALTAELKNNEVDIADVSNLKNADKEILKESGFSIYSHENNMIQVMGVNMTSAKMQDKSLRQAMMMAINRQAMVDQLLEGNGTIANTTILKSSWAYPSEDQLNQYEYNVEKAKTLLEEAGYNYEGDLLYKDGEQITLNLICPTGNAMREKTAQIIQQNLKEIGIEVTIESMEFPAMMDTIFAEDKKYEAFMMGSNQAIDPDTSAYWSSEGAWNMTGFSNEKADELLKEGQSKVDIEERQPIYQDFGALINDELPFLYLYNQNVEIAANEKIKGFNPSVFRDFSQAHLWEIGK